MIRLLDKSRITWFNYFYIFCIIIYAGRATVFARDLGDIRTFGNAFALLITVYFFIINKVQFTRDYKISISIFLLYAVVTSINNRIVNPFWILQWLIWLTIAYGVCQGLGKRLFVTVETVLLHLSMIALIIWVIDLIFPSVVEHLVKFFEFSKPYTEDGNVAANMIFYTLSSDYGSAAVADFIIFSKRNPGFAWEPGAFACFICLGIYCNILRNNIKFNNNGALWVFLLALLSAQSTTGFSTLILMMGVWMLANRKYGWGLVVVPMAMLIFSLPFVGDKMMMEYESLGTIDVDQLHGGALGRTYSLILDFQEFLRHPIIGLGGWTEGTLLAQSGNETATISGIGDLLVRFGAIMSLVFFILLVKSCKKIQYDFQSPNSYILIVVILAMMYSYGLWTTPLYIALWMYGVYSPISKTTQPRVVQLNDNSVMRLNDPVLFDSTICSRC